MQRTLPVLALLMIALLTLPGALSALIIALLSFAASPLALVVPLVHFTPLGLGFLFYLLDPHKGLFIVAGVLFATVAIPILISFITYDDALPLYLEEGWILQYFFAGY